MQWITYLILFYTIAIAGCLCIRLLILQCRLFKQLPPTLQMTLKIRTCGFFIHCLCNTYYVLHNAHVSTLLLPKFTLSLVQCSPNLSFFVFVLIYSCDWMAVSNLPSSRGNSNSTSMCSSSQWSYQYWLPYFYSSNFDCSWHSSGYKQVLMEFNFSQLY